MKHEKISMFVFFVSLLCFSPVLEAAINDTLTASGSLSFDQTLISAGGNFELGFFSKGNPKRYYLGIWYKDIPTNDIIWVANRDSPSPNTSCTLHVSNTGNLMILHLSNLIWSSNLSTSAVDPAVQILDSGNLVVRAAGDQDPNHYHWQSFNNPTDTLVPGLRLEFNNTLGVGRPFTSWQGPNDPSSGNFSFAAGLSGSLHLYLTKERRQVIYMTPAVQQWTAHDPLMEDVPATFFNYTYTYTADEVNYVLQQPGPPNARVKLRIMVTYDGVVQEWMWNAHPNTTRWTLLWATGRCYCGPYGICDNIGQVCQCPHGFKPTDPVAWRSGNWSAGCGRNNRLKCRSDGFMNLENVKVLQQTPGFSFVNESMDIQQCREICKSNCNCMAYGSSQVVNEGSGSSGCVVWTGNVPVVRNFTQGGQILYLRVAASDLANGTKWTPSRMAVVIVVPTIITTMFLAVGVWIYMYKCHKRPNLEMNEIKSLDSLQFELHTVRAATKNFSFDNKLGQGGFGEVYKGIFEDGQEIAVKRLSDSSAQGALEFKTEILLVAKLQHKNLVKLLGFCLASKEKILIYEYLRNSSLDRFLFDSTKKKSLDWRTRFRIAVGIARGLMYLHVDSRLKVIHRDLKTSNILLDENMNPKIADFGLAKLFGIDQTQDNTKRIVGTYGYMAPEYAMTGQFSVKSDVYSFGIIVLEIVSGQRSKFTISQEDTEALLHRAWRLWNEDKFLDLVDTSLGNEDPTDEIRKCIHIGLLCIQENPLGRPTMETVVATLSGEAITLPMPKAPQFLGYTTSSKEVSYSGSDVITITQMDPR